MDASEVELVTPSMTVVAATSAVVTGQDSFGLTTGIFRSGLLANEGGVTMTAKNILLIGKHGSIDADTLFEVRVCPQ